MRIPPVEGSPASIGLLVGSAVFVFDQATKTLADTLLIPNRLVEFVPDWVPFFSSGFGWQLIYNPGGALGFDPDTFFGRFVGQWFFLLVTGIVTVIVARNLPRTLTMPAGLAYGLLLSGAWGNGIDRVLRAPGFPRGQVVDFIATRVPDWFPIDQPQLARFNVADVAIGVGFILLLRSLSREDHARAVLDGADDTTAAT